MSTLTAGEVVERIKANLGFPWRATSRRDTFKFGGPDTVVTGIATTMFCSYDAIRHAVEAGCNMMIPHEDTYWNDADDLSLVDKDPSYKLKVDYMREHNVVVFRIHDHMHTRSRTGSTIGLARALGLESAAGDGSADRTTLRCRRPRWASWRRRFQKQLGDKALRVVGDPKAKVSRLQIGVGYATPAVNDPNVDIVVERGAAGDGRSRWTARRMYWMR